MSALASSPMALAQQATPSASPPYAELFAVSGVASDDYWAVGARIVDHGADERNYAEHWDGNAWQKVSTPEPRGSFNDLFTSVDALSPKSVWAVGWAQPGFVEVAPFAAHWNGRTWSDMYLKTPTGSQDTFINGVDSTSDSDVWAVGSTDGTEVRQPLIEHWSGAHWSIVSPSSHLPKNAGLSGVRALAGDDAWAVGDQRMDGKTRPFAEHFDGTTWKVVSVPLPPGEQHAGLFEIAGDTSDDVWTVGCTITHTPHPVIEHWDGSHWHVVRANVTNNDMVPTGLTVVSPDDVWAVGYNLERQTVFVHWDGSAFHQVRVKTGNDLVGALAFTSPDDGMAVGLARARRNGHRIVVPAHLRWNGHVWHVEG